MMPFAHPLRFRPAAASDLGGLARFIARQNREAATRCLHAGGGSADAAEVRRGLAEFPGGAESGFVLAERAADGETVGAAGVQLAGGDGSRGWLWGPFVAPEIAVGEDSFRAVARPLLGRWLVERGGGVREVEAFLDAENRRGLRFLLGAGFRARQRTHIFVAPRRALGPADEPFCGELREMHAAGFARLHEGTFPTDADEHTTAAALLAGRDAEHRIFAATDGGLRLLGYLCASVNHVPREGFVDFLAVKDAARGRGLGGRLLRTALRWFFEELDLPQAALCVSEWRAERGGARRAYEREGFARRFTGIGARRVTR